VILSLLLLAVILRALTRPLDSRWARLYLWCEAGGIAFIAGLLLAGIAPKTELYAGLWVLLQFLIFFSASLYAGSCLAKAHHPWYVGFVSLSLPVALSFLMYVLLRSGHATLPYWVWFALGRGQVEGTLGLITACKPGLLSRTIGFLWLTQCCYQYAFSAGIVFHRGQWITVNNWLPQLIAIAGFGFLALRSPSHPASPQARLAA
jgi:hypothetical protein